MEKIKRPLSDELLIETLTKPDPALRRSWTKEMWLASIQEGSSTSFLICLRQMKRVRIIARVDVLSPLCSDVSRRVFRKSPRTMIPLIKHFFRTSRSSFSDGTKIAGTLVVLLTRDKTREMSFIVSHSSIFVKEKLSNDESSKRQRGWRFPRGNAVLPQLPLLLPLLPLLLLWSCCPRTVLLLSPLMLESGNEDHLEDCAFCINISSIYFAGKLSALLQAV
jgi:hypothetical protein